MSIALNGNTGKIILNGTTYYAGGVSGSSPTPSSANIEKLCYATEDSTGHRDTDHVHIAYFDDNVGYIQEGTNYSEYLDYNSTTKKFEVVKSFYGLLKPWTYNYKQASSTTSRGELYVNDTKISEWDTDHTAIYWYMGIPYIHQFAVGDTFYIYTPSSNGYPEQNLEVYNLGSSENASSMGVVLEMYGDMLSIHGQKSSS